MIVGRFNDQALLAAIAPVAGGGGAALPVTAGLYAWFKADEITGKTNGQEVSQWLDSSGNGRDSLTSSAGACPVYTTNKQHGLPGLDFDGSNDRVDLSSISLSFPLSVFVVSKTPNNYNSPQPIITSLSNSWMIGSYGWNDCFHQAGGSNIDGPATDGTCIYTSLVQVAGANGTTWRRNGTLWGTVTTGTAPGQLWLGYGGATRNPLGGAIMEIIIYNTNLSGADVLSVESYIKTKWGL